jgi:predicted Co/Zn/Cd cation transporter (cation efflux family)
VAAVTATGSARDQRLIMLSIWVSAGFAVFSTIWGIWIGSSLIVFDGLYSFVSIGLSVLAVLALRFTSRGADERFPWGRDVAEPLVVVVKAATLGALCIYAAIGGVIDIVAGGRQVSAVSAVVYAIISTVAGLVVGLVLRRASREVRDGDPPSDLVRAEAAEWLGDTLLSAGVLLGFIVALILVGAGRADLAAYIDPGMVVLVSLIFLWVPAKLIIAGMREVLSMSPAPEIMAELRSVVDAIGTEHGFQETFLRAAKVGGRVDIEIDYVVGADSPVRTVADTDAVRAELRDRLAALGYERSVAVSFTHDRRFAT